MIKIAHRGNYKGRNASLENSPAYIYEALNNGYDAEIDVWLLDREWYLGHDFPKYHIQLEWLQDRRLWVHAKNLEGYVSLYNNPKVHVFWHNKDDFVFTSKGIKWANTGVITHDGIMVMPELTPGIIEELRLERIVPLGICSDNFSLFDL
jgi:hypothetical protein